MVSRNRKYSKRLKRSIKQKGGITLMEGKYAFFLNKKKYEELLGKPIIDEKAPSIKDIMSKFHLSGYYIKNNTNSFHLIGWDNLTDEEKSKYKKNYDERVETSYFLNDFKRHNPNKDWISGNPEIITINSINLDDPSNVEQHLKKQFNYYRIIPPSYYYLRQEEIVKYTDHISWYASVDDSYFCVIIQVNNLRPNKYLNFIENNIEIIKEQDLIDEEKKKNDEEVIRLMENKLLILNEKLKKLEESPSYQKMLPELIKLKLSKIDFDKTVETKMSQKKFYKKYNMLYNTMLDKYKISIENEINFNNENYIDKTLSDDKETLENLLKLKNKYSHYLK